MQKDTGNTRLEKKLQQGGLINPGIDLQQLNTNFRLPALLFQVLSEYTLAFYQVLQVLILRKQQDRSAG